MASLLLVVKHALEARRAAENMTRIERDTATTQTISPTAGATAPGDTRKLRGIPAIGRGVAGHIPGTHPEDATR